MPRIKEDWISGTFGEYILICLQILGQSLDVCNRCGEAIGHPIIHHNKYDGATIYDLEIVCSGCNNKAENQGLI